MAKPNLSFAMLLGWGLCQFLVMEWGLQSAPAPVADSADPIYAGQRDLQQVILRAIQRICRCDFDRIVTLSMPVMIQKEKLRNSALVIVKAKGVAVTDLELVGNAESVPQKERAPLLVIHAGDFRL